jgi:hypothetical protein
MKFVVVESQMSDKSGRSRWSGLGVATLGIGKLNCGKGSFLRGRLIRLTLATLTAGIG